MSGFPEGTFTFLFSTSPVLQFSKAVAHFSFVPCDLDVPPLCNHKNSAFKMTISG